MKRLFVITSEMLNSIVWFTNSDIFKWYRYSVFSSEYVIKKMKKSNKFKVVRFNKKRGETITHRVVNFSKSIFLNNLQ